MKESRVISRCQPRAFTLMELMVAVAILLGVLALVATIFSTASKAGGQAAAMSTLYRQLEQAADIIDRDLSGIDNHTGASVLGIAGKRIQAADTTKSNGVIGLHRADVLMMFTQRDPDPYIFTDATATLGQTIEVVYGHADFGHFDTMSGTWKFDQIIEDQNVPAVQKIASQWHLARRCIAFPAAPYGGSDPGAILPATLTDFAFLSGQADVYRQTYSYLQINGCIPQSALLQYALTGWMFWTDPGSGIGYAINYSGGNAVQYVYSGDHWNPPVPGSVPPTLATLPAMLFYNAAVANRRTVINPNPPVGAIKPMACHFLPNCSDFKVEYTYDDPRQLQLNPATGDVAVDATTRMPLPLPTRWQTVPDGGQIVWSRLALDPYNPASPNAGTMTDPRRWPRALRITIKAWDAGGRLQDPVTRTIVHVFQ